MIALTTLISSYGFVVQFGAELRSIGINTEEIGEEGINKPKVISSIKRFGRNSNNA